jgi:hypothetical protein
VPRAVANKLYRTFVKGLITEAGPLTYPENASINEDNCVIYQSGNRSRREGIDWEIGASPSQYITNTDDFANLEISEYVWQSAGNDSSKNFLVLQIGRFVHFHDMASAPLRSGYKSFIVDLNDFAVSGQVAGSATCSFISGKGYLFVVSQKTEPFLIQYDPVNDAFVTQRIYIQIRDFKGLDDGLANDEEPGSLSGPHDYNLRNQGWLDPGAGGGGSTVTYYTEFGGSDTYAQATTSPISSYFSSAGRYPSNSKQWWIAKDATTGTFDPALLNKFFFGNTRAPRGHYVVEAFNIDRSSVSGVASLPVESVNTRPESVAFFAGRVWYAHNSTVYFSQILDDKRKAGFCYQEADPTSESISDLIATDGGAIPIPEMIKALKLMPIAGGVMVFAANGLWFISGTQAGFTATDITVTKVSPIGTNSPRSVIHVQDSGGDFILWWSEVGIQAIQQRMGQFGAIDNAFDNTILSQTTIQTFFNNIPKTSLANVKAHYDPSTNVVQWLFNDGTYNFKNSFNRILNFDLTLKAFYPWTISTIDNLLGPFICGVFKAINPEETIRNRFTRYITIVPSSGYFYYMFGQESDKRFADWGTQGFNSFVETGYELMEDAMRDKQAMYVFCYFRRTEAQYVEIDDTGEFTFGTPSSCYLQIKWDWSNSQISNRWSTKQQVYRLTRVPIFDEDNLAVDTGFPVVVTRSKVRGHGKAIQFRFENAEIGSNFDLLGWSVPYSGNTQP